VKRAFAAKVNPDLVIYDSDGKPYMVRYEAINAMLLNEFLKEHRRIEEQDKRIDQLTAQLKEQAALIQKVSDRFCKSSSTISKAAAHHSLNSPLCSCVSITLPASP
jgi:hypothetical protein